MKFSYSAMLFLMGLMGSVAAAQDGAPGNQPTAVTGTPRTIYLWTSGGLDNVAKPETWGNGSATPAKDVTYDGASVLKITTRNFGEGARLDLKSPVDLAPYRTSGILRFRLRFNEQEVAPVVGGPEGGPGGRPGMGGPGGRPGMGGPGGRPGMGGPGGRPNTREDLLMAPTYAAPTVTGQAQIGALPPLGGAGDGFGGEEMPGFEGAEGIPLPVGPPPQKTPITAIQVTMVLEKGIISGRLNIDLDKVKPDATGWSFFVMALKDMRATPDATGPLKRLLITGDREDSFYLAQAALVLETGTMLVNIRRPSEPVGTRLTEITVKPGPLTLVADIEAGAADPEVEWNFDADKVGNLPPAPNQIVAPVDMGDNEGVDGEENPRNPRQAGPEDGGADGAEAEPVIVGPRIDARGLVATFEYPDEEQNYRVEATVRDRTGKKADVVVSVLISVRG